MSRRVRFLWVRGARRAFRKNAGSPRRLQKIIWTDSGKTLLLIADGKTASRTEDAGGENRGRERPGPPRGVLAPKSGEKGGSPPATVWIFPRRNCSWFQLGSSGAAIGCSAVALDRDAERKVERAFW